MMGSKRNQVLTYCQTKFWFTFSPCCRQLSNVFGRASSAKDGGFFGPVPNLKFDSGDHKTLTSFSNFVYRFVFIHKGHNINTLFAAAIECNPKVIDIQSSFELMLPQCLLFNCKTLADLALKGSRKNIVHMVPMNGVYLPALKKLELSYVRFDSEESIVHLLSGCPVLEELTIHKGVDKAVCFRVSSPTLTRLDLEIDEEFGDYYTYEEDYEVKLDTPALKYLRLHDSLSHGFSAGMLASLNEADVYFYDHTASFNRVLYCAPVIEFVGELNNVSCLKLNTSQMELPDSGFTREFRNLAELEFSGDWHLVANFLEKTDNLKVLIFITVHDGWVEPKHMPLCVKYNLGTVRFDEFGCKETEFKMVEYILRNARVLKRMEIDVLGVDVDKKYEALKRISLFERASEACRLTFDRVTLGVGLSS